MPSTPCLMLDLDALDRNIARMATHARAHGLALRPHAKTHKSRAIAALQEQAGASGICCATLHEAEQLAGAVRSILLTSPVATSDAFARIAALVGRELDLAVVVDHPSVVPALATALPPPRVSWPVRWMEFSHITATVPSPGLVGDTPFDGSTTPACGAGNIWVRA